MNKLVQIIFFCSISTLLFSMEEEKKSFFSRKFSKSKSISAKNGIALQDSGNKGQNLSPEEIAFFVEYNTKFPDGNELQLSATLTILKQSKPEEYERIQKMLETVKKNKENNGKS